MKKRQARRILDAEIKSFGHRISLLTFENNIVTSQFKEAHIAFKEYIDRVKKHSDPAIRKHILKDAFMGCSSVGSDVTKGKGVVIRFPLGWKSIKVREKEYALVENLNRQYSWLLVSTYEAYEHFIKELYACMGFLDSAFWQCEDYGCVRVSEIHRLKLAWFKERVRQRSNQRFRQGTSYALKQFRKAFPETLCYERVALPAAKTYLYSDAVFHEKVRTLTLGLTCLLAEKLRHAIVHNQGAIEGVEILCENIGANGAKRKTIVAGHFKDSAEGPRIWLVNDQKGVLDHRFLDLRITHILQSLCAHACLVYKACIIHFGEQAFWDRKSEGKHRK